MILIYSSRLTNRLSYTCEFIFNRVLQVDYRLTNESSKYSEFKGAKLCYDNERLQDGVFVQPSNLLFESDIKPHRMDVAGWEDVPILFPVNGKSFIPFDLFSAVFYMLSRYEEYLPHELDHHRRYKVKECLAYRNGFLERPIVNLWIRKVANVLNEKFPELYFPPLTFTLLPTIDIDNAYAVRHRGFVRNALSLIKALATFQFNELNLKISILTGAKNDPFDSYDRQIDLHLKYAVQARYFVLLGDQGRYDGNLSHKNSAYRRLIQRLRKKAVVGIHPSYESNRNQEKLREEKSRLEEILNEGVTQSRQHYIKLKFPETYRNLVVNGIKEDFSMGYPAHSGFRAGTCTPFLFFDLEKNEVSDLLLHPFCVMDTTLKKYQQIPGKDAVAYVSKFIEEVAKVGGEFCFIFHNESLGGSGYWKNWTNVYENILKVALTKLR